ncbi:hypothetical protein ACWT_8026 [Actinoplanes sp. SE50]|uniref:hypothetical protein n=1 Tax=unclassified Actinoplanes TaxID=2626549 RepID=UPI00023EE0CB|nr:MULTISPECIES: hypothetical protein [unclassified Actinoplanes]AEV89035.1 hypothetical protein ACPL_8157 [Actinoplanes sp. SE50/110]ATO87441.1 hypothetical protein ACWT_8026 [Actinoplanes sp. SE50]SLM04859.1 hypothetical protein ACSP50_8171 [Actinoplanes sp. SE50/110]
MDVVDFWVRSWTSDDLAAARRVLSPHVEVEWNLDAPVDDEELLQVLHRIAVFADHVALTARTDALDGAALIYDLTAPFGSARLAEFLAVEDEKIVEIRHVYDVTAIDRYFPGLYAN